MFQKNVETSTTDNGCRSSVKPANATSAEWQAQDVAKYQKKEDEEVKSHLVLDARRFLDSVLSSLIRDQQITLYQVKFSVLMFGS